MSRQAEAGEELVLSIETKQFVRFTLSDQQQFAFLQVPVLSDTPMLPSQLKDDWEYAVAYRNLIGIHAGRPRELQNIHVRATAGILELARREKRRFGEKLSEKLDTWVKSPFGELELEETLEALHGPWPPPADQILVQNGEPEPRHHLVLFDSSISMHGERFAMQMAGLAILASSIPATHLSVVGFDSQTTVIKPFREPMVPAQLVSLALQCVPQGSTDIAAAIEKGEELKKRASQSRVLTVLLTDGQQTSGKNPLSVAGRLAPLIVIPLNPHPDTLLQCRSLAREGRGALIPIESYKEIPAAMALLSRRTRRE